MRDTSPRSRELLVKAARMYFLDSRSQDDIARRARDEPVERLPNDQRRPGARASSRSASSDEGGRGRGPGAGARGMRFGLVHVRVAAFQPRQDATGRRSATWRPSGWTTRCATARSWRCPGDRRCRPWSARSSVEEPPQARGRAAGRGHRPTGGSLAPAHELVRELAARLGATYRYLHGPALLRSATARAALLAEPSSVSGGSGPVGGHRPGRASAPSCRGRRPRCSTAWGWPPPSTRSWLAQNPAGDTCCRFFDSRAGTVTVRWTVGSSPSTLDDLRRIPTVVGVACGTEKRRECARRAAGPSARTVWSPTPGWPARCSTPTPPSRSAPKPS